MRKSGNKGRCRLLILKSRDFVSFSFSIMESELKVECNGIIPQIFFTGIAAQQTPQSWWRLARKRRARRSKAGERKKIRTASAAENSGYLRCRRRRRRSRERGIHFVRAEAARRRAASLQKHAINYPGIAASTISCCISDKWLLSRINPRRTARRTRKKRDSRERKRRDQRCGSRGSRAESKDP